MNKLLVDDDDDDTEKQNILRCTYSIMWQWQISMEMGSLVLNGYAFEYIT